MLTKTLTCALSLLSLLILSASACAQNGCTDPNACNFDPNAANNDGSCAFYIDCAGICGGPYVQDACGNCYDPNNVAGEEQFNYTGGLQTFIVPSGVNEISIEAHGAQGGTSTGQNGNQNFIGGLGARMSGTFNVNPGDNLTILVGQQGANGSCGSGGGGGSFVVFNGQPLIIAGGGGGGFHCNVLGGNNGDPGLTGNNGGNGVEPPTHPSPYFRPGAVGGINGNGGFSAYGGGGGGWFSPGTSLYGGAGGGVYPGNGGAPGGGYGGGGGYFNGCCGGSGGGGGYSGGSGGESDGCAGGGGGSYNIGNNQDNQEGANNGNGLVSITYGLLPICSIGCTNPIACNFNPNATEDDGSCILPDGCTDQAACNYNPAATCDDGSCSFGACDDPAACNFDPGAICNNGSCTYFIDCAGICGGTNIEDLCGNCYDPNIGGLDQFDFTGSMQTWTVPNGVSSIIVEAAGAQGGNSSYGVGGLGANITGTIDVIPGEILNVVIGGQGSGNVNSGGGGGGTFIVRQNGNIPLVIAGGGGGAGGYQETNPGALQDGKPAEALENGSDSQPSANQWVIAPGYGGANGNGGTGGQSHRPGGGGGGFFSDGGEYVAMYGGGQWGWGGNSYLNGATGGLGEGNNAGMVGGFGGGGGGALGGGGGGGYSGGGGGTWSGYNATDWGHGGGGGGSYNSGTDPINSGGVQSGNGYATFTFGLAPECLAGCLDPEACNYDPQAQLDAGNCEYPDGCNDVNACNFNPAATCNDGTCVYPGCNDPAACNYDPGAGCGDGSCAFIIDCAGICGGSNIEDFCGNCYDPNNAEGEVQFNYTGSLQFFTVPAGVSEITIHAYGAEGGTSTGENGNQNFVGGLGAHMSGAFNVNPGDILNVLVGQRGTNSNCGSGGGGGSFVVQNGQPLIIAGGGGGGFHCNVLGGNNGAPGLIGNNGGNGVEPPAHPNPYFRPGAVGGINGNGGYSAFGGGGGGWFSPGTGLYGGAGGGMYPGNGGAPGGGYGGGGGYYNGCCGGSGGGGGYSGGSGGESDGCAGGGGGSYNIGANQFNQQGVQLGNGIVIINYGNTPECYAGCTDPIACNYDPGAQIEDGSCNYPDGCNYVNACNYDPSATCDDGTCIYPGCNDIAACNYDPGAGCGDGSCLFIVDCAGICGGTNIEDLCGNCYDPNIGGLDQFDFTGSMQTWTVPNGVSSIIVEAAGAQGGNSSYGVGGLGANITGTIDVIPGEILNVVIGGQGSGNVNSGGGGGGTFIVRQNGNIPLVIAGGGGGAGGYQETNPGALQDGKPAEALENGSDSQPSANQWVIAPGYGGANGNGGTGGQSHRPGGGGGGFFSDGGEYVAMYGGGQWGWGGNSYLNGATGGLGEGNNAGMVGGFGGGGGGALGGGGGGGYSGGGGGTWSGYNATDWGHGGGGGGSYNSGTNPINSGGVHSGNGYALFSYGLAPDCVEGCIDPLACNYDPEAQLDGENCTYPDGCNDPTACNFDPGATCDDGTCVFPGCDDQAACNYDPGAGCGDGSCAYLIDCAGICGGPNIVDACGNCYDPNNAAQETLTFNYSGSIQQWIVPDGLNEINVELYGAQGGASNSCDFQVPSPEADGGLGGFAGGTLNVSPGQTLYIYVGGQGGIGLDGPPEAGFNGGGNGGYWGAGGGGASDIRTVSGDFGSRLIVAAGGGGGNTGCPNHGHGGDGGGLNGDLGLAFTGYTPAGGASQNAGGTPGDNGAFGSFGLGGSTESYHFAGGGGGWYGGGSAYAAGGGGGSSYINGVINGATQTGVQTGNGYIVISYDNIPECSLGCTNPSAINYNPNATEDDGSCIIPGCTNPQANNYNPEATEDDGSCLIPGCTYQSALNYNADANVDDGSCQFNFGGGCTDANACNFDPNAQVDNGGCCYDCFGCTDEGACNFDPNASVDEGNCDFSCWGCTYADAINYNAAATKDDGSCDYSCMGDFNNDGYINTGDLLQFLIIFGTICQ